MKIGTKIISLGLLLLSGVGFVLSQNNGDSKVKEADAVGKSAYWDSWVSNNNAALSTGGTTLVTALKSKITQIADGNANTVSYDGLWSAYASSDSVPGANGTKIWDMYGGFQFSYQSSGKSYTKEGDCYNREHSVPKSWFGEAKPAYSDLVHLVPTDGKVNGQRSNYTFGEVESASYSYAFNAQTYNSVQYQSAGVSKLGTPKAINGVSPTNISNNKVFEPDDQYKGDFARIYMYFAVRYGGGTCAATTGDGASIFTNTFTNANPYVTNYGLALLRKWHVQDPVSEKETARNNAIEFAQGNRNPFVDYPEWADKIFGSNYASANGGGNEQPANPQTVSQRIVSKTNSTYYETGAICLTGDTDSASCECDGFNVSWLKNSSTTNINYTYAELRIYGGHSFTITPKTGYLISSVVLTANSNSYASALGDTSLNNCTKTVDDSEVTLTPTNGAAAVGFTQNTQTRINYIIVNYAPVIQITSLSASVSKTYYVGETISTSDITVKDNNNDTIESFTFTNDGYKFLYSDASSGGALTDKTFENAITFNELTCDLTVQVQRKTPTEDTVDVLDQSVTGIAGTDYTDFSDKSVTSSAKYAGQCAGDKSSIQLRSKNSNSGIISTTSAGKRIKSVSVTWHDDTAAGRTLNVYGKNTAYSAATDLYATGTQGSLLGTIVKGTSTSLVISGDYTYIGLRSSDSAMYLTSISIAYGPAETAANVANFIMINDTNGQCTGVEGKLDKAILRLNTMTTSEKSSFWGSTESDSYVIFTARTRLNAWAAHEHKTLTYSNGTFSASCNSEISAFYKNQTDVSILFVIISIASITALGGFLFIKHKKEE